MSRRTAFEDWGTISYKEAWDRQSQIHDHIKALKLENQRAGTKHEYLHHLIFCNHPPVYTLGKSGKDEHLLINESERAEKGVEYFKINRGGDITYHGPGQIIAYPIFDLDLIFTDVHKYVRFLEEAVIRTLADYQLQGIRMKEHTGVWLEKTVDKPYRKICAIGVHLSRWVTMHGLAFNINTELSYFNNIIPCGINEQDKSVSSLNAELGRQVKLDEVKQKLKGHFIDLFELELIS